MPLYDYRCTKCDREVEVMHGIHETGPETCQHCGGAMRKALSSPAIHFKGSGWAKKDAASSAKKSTAKPSSGEKAAAKSSDAGSGDAGGSSDAKGETGSASEAKTTTTAGSTTE